MGSRQNITIGVIGAGAVGTFYAAHFAKAGANVVLMTRTPEAYYSDDMGVCDDGSSYESPPAPIFIESCNGDFEFIPKDIILLDKEDPLLLKDYRFDLLVVATKVDVTRDMVSLISPFMGPDTLLLLIQNGLFIEDTYVKTFSQPIIRGLAFLCANRVSKRHVLHLDYGALTLGYVQGNGPAPLLADLVLGMDVSVSWTHTIDRSIWEKLVWNVPFNPLSVVYGGVTTDVLVNTPDICDRVRLIMQEVCLAARAFGVELPKDIMDKKIAETKAMAPYKTSMCLDFLSGLPLETEAIVGNLLRFCNTQALHVPYIETLYNELIDLKA
jgi:2-dehydropantoate 2-reductase